MKTRLACFSVEGRELRSPRAAGPHATLHRERGSAVVLFIVLLGIMLALVAANGKTLVVLKKDLQLIEQRQIQRLEKSQTTPPASITAIPLETRPAPATP